MRTSFSKRTLSSAWASAKRIFSATGVCRHSAALRGDSNQRGLEADLARSRARTAPRRDAAARMTMPNDPRPSSTPSFSVSLLTFQSFISRSFIAAPVQLRLHRRRHAGPHLGEPCAFLSGSQEGLEAINARAPAAGPGFSARAENEVCPPSEHGRSHAVQIRIRGTTSKCNAKCWPVLDAAASIRSRADGAPCPARACPRHFGSPCGETGRRGSIKAGAADMRAARGSNRSREAAQATWLLSWRGGVLPAACVGSRRAWVRRGVGRRRRGARDGSCPRIEEGEER